MQKIVLIFLLFTLSLFASIGKVTGMMGDAFIKRNAGAIPVVKGISVEKNDILSTEKNAKIQVTFNDGTVITIGKNSKFSIEDYLFDEETPDNSKSNMKFLKGTFKSITGKIGKLAPHRFKIATKTATMGIRGSIGVGSQEKFACTDGGYDVSSQGVTRQVDAGMMVDTPVGQPPSVPRAFTPADIGALTSGINMKTTPQQDKKAAATKKKKKKASKKKNSSKNEKKAAATPAPLAKTDASTPSSASIPKTPIPAPVTQSFSTNPSGIESTSSVGSAAEDAASTATEEATKEAADEATKAAVEKAAAEKAAAEKAAAEKAAAEKAAAEKAAAEKAAAEKAAAEKAAAEKAAAEKAAAEKAAAEKAAAEKAAAEKAAADAASAAAAAASTVSTTNLSGKSLDGIIADTNIIASHAEALKIQNTTLSYTNSSGTWSTITNSLSHTTPSLGAYTGYTQDISLSLNGTYTYNSVDYPYVGTVYVTADNTAEFIVMKTDTTFTGYDSAGKYFDLGYAGVSPVVGNLEQDKVLIYDIIERLEIKDNSGYEHTFKQAADTEKIYLNTKNATMTVVSSKPEYAQSFFAFSLNKTNGAITGKVNSNKNSVFQTDTIQSSSLYGTNLQGLGLYLKTPETKYTMSRAPVSGDTISIDINGNSYSATYSTSAAATYASLSAAILAGEATKFDSITANGNSLIFNPASGKTLTIANLANDDTSQAGTVTVTTDSIISNQNIAAAYKNTTTPVDVVTGTSSAMSGYVNTTKNEYGTISNLIINKDDATISGTITDTATLANYNMNLSGSSASSSSYYINNDIFGVKMAANGTYQPESSAQENYITDSGWMVTLNDNTNSGAADDEMSWGYWVSSFENSKEIDYRSVWVAGIPTVSMPISGTANFSGQIIGSVQKFADNSIDPILVDSDNVFSFSIDFGNSTDNITAGIAKFKTGSDKYWKSEFTGASSGTNFSIAHADMTGKGNATDAALAGGTAFTAGQMQGTFYGSDAKGVAGRFDLNIGTHQASGVFKAKNNGI